MAKAAYLLVTGLALTVTPFTNSEAAAQDERAALVLHVDNYAHVTAASITRAEQAVSAVFADAGLVIEWVNDAAVSAVNEDGRRHLHVLLLCAEMTHAKVTSERVPDNVMGQAAPGSTRAYIYTFRVRNFALHNGRSFDGVLAHVMAHEVGHLLLPPGSHSKRGIMRESLDVQAYNERFTIQQGDALRLALNR